VSEGPARRQFERQAARMREIVQALSAAQK
jgi:hypothetical protein